MRPEVNVTVGGPKKPTNYTYKTVILKSNLPFDAQVTEPNCIYTIKWDFDLKGETVTIPENCVLKFEGGSLRNGTLEGNNTFVAAEKVKVFNTDVTFDGTWAFDTVYPEWFGAVADSETDCLGAFNSSIQLLEKCKKSVQYYRIDKPSVSLCLSGGDYYVSDTIVVPCSINIDGNNSKIVIKCSLSKILYFSQSRDIDSNDLFSGCIDNLQIEGNCYNATAIYILDGAGCFINNVRIRNCVGNGIYVHNGTELQIKNCSIGLMSSRVQEAYAKSSILRGNDYSSLVGICFRDDYVNDCSIDSVFVQNIPRGIVVGSSIMMTNIHVWGYPQVVNYDGSTLVTTCTNVAIGITCQHNCQMVNIYADTVLKQDSTQGYYAPVNGIFNGGYGVYVRGNNNVVNGLACYVNLSVIPSGFTVATNNAAVVVDSPGNAFYNIQNNSPVYYQAAGGNTNGNIFFNTGIPNSFLDEGKRIPTDLASRLQCSESENSIDTKVNLGTTGAKRKRLLFYGGQKQIGSIEYGAWGGSAEKTPFYFGLGDLDSNGFTASVVKNIISGICIHLLNKEEVPNNGEENVMARGFVTYGYPGWLTAPIPYLWYRFGERNYRIMLEPDIENFGDVRPDFTDYHNPVPPGYMFFDTAIGKPIWWNGTKWILSDGTDAPVE